MRGAGLKVRVATALVLLPTVFVLVWAPPLRIGLVVFVALVACVGLYEYFALLRARGLRPETGGGIVAGLAVVLSGGFGGEGAAMGALGLGCLAVAIVHVLRGGPSLGALVPSLAGIAYVGWFAAHALLLHRVPAVGPGLFTILVVAVAATDTAAYFAGRALGRHKLAPRLSPNKTWEGAVGGLVFALVCMLALYGLRARWGWAAAFPEWTLLRYLVAGAALSFACQAGDLAESGLKRAAGVKDSGVAFPGHGGVLDRCDGFLFAAPVLYYVAVP